MEKEELLQKIKEAGVVGAGGAGFPTHIKINNKVRYVIANGAECEPLLQVDQQLMTFYPEKIISGLRYVLKITEAETGIIALKAKYRSSVESLKKHIQPKDNIQLKLLESYYPAGDEHQLVYQVTGKTVPEAGLPLNVSSVVDNIGTLYHIDEALQGLPVVNKHVTVNGEVERPRTYLAAIGTPFADLLRLSGWSPRDSIVINGGPLMGKTADPENEVVTKTTSGLIVLPRSHVLARKKTEDIHRSIRLSKTLCIQCNTCTENCPRNGLGHDLKPHLLMRKVSLGAEEIDDRFTDALLCCECGVCGYYSCPMDLLPVKIIQYIKNILVQKKIQNKDWNKNPVPSPFYQEKLIPTEKIVARLNLLRYDHKKALLVKKVYEPNLVRIPLRQHIGVEAKPVVETGQKVRKTDLIADVPSGMLGSRIHASLSGVVTRVTKNFIEIKM